MRRYTVRAILYKKVPKTTQSGQDGSAWVLETEESGKIRVDPVTGWSGGSERSMRLAFKTREAAISYATRSGISWREIGVSDTRRHMVRSYADNFASGRRGAWTH